MGVFIVESHRIFDSMRLYYQASARLLFFHYFIFSLFYFFIILFFHYFIFLLFYFFIILFFYFICYF